jgi:putative transposase
MARGRKRTPEQIVSLLGQIEVGTANGKTLPQACKEAGIAEQTYYRWRKEYGGLKVDQANAKLKRLVAELNLDKQVLQKLSALVNVSGVPAGLNARNTQKRRRKSLPSGEF